MTQSSSRLLRLTIQTNHLSAKRLDKLLSQEFPELSRTRVRELLEQQQITALPTTAALNLAKLPPLGTQIEIHLPEPQDSELRPWDFKLDILFEDEHLLFLNKPAGLVVHPAAGHEDHTLVHALLHHCQDLRGIGDEKRPGIVHRLDIGTSGVMIVAKHQQCHEALVNVFQAHDLRRHYQALIYIKQPLRCREGTLTSLIGRHPKDRKRMSSKVSEGKQAITHYRLLKKWEAHPQVAHLELTLETGRTHQIRVHLSELLTAPILGDQTYGHFTAPLLNKLLGPQGAQLLAQYPYPLLHARTLGLKHPMTGEWMEFSTQPPSPFVDLLHYLSYN